MTGCGPPSSLRHSPRDPVAGFKVVGTVQPPRAAGEVGLLDDWLDDVSAWVGAHNVHAVAVAESTTTDPELLRRLSWRLEGPRVDLLVSPHMSDVAGPRVSRCGRPRGCPCCTWTSRASPDPSGRSSGRWTWPSPSRR